ncbi:MAG: cyclic nucleotide-binding domain-containing protein, partial [Gammaproteobacteria bacterium]
ASVVRTMYDAAHIPSKRTRSPAQTKLLKELGHKIIGFELQGDLVFASAEIVATEVMQAARHADYLILDLQRVAVIKEGALHLLGDLIQSLYAQGKTALLTNIWEKYAIVKGLKTQVPSLEDLTLVYQEDVDHALEWCEDPLLAKHSSFVGEDKVEMPLAAQALCAGFTNEELTKLGALVDAHTYDKGRCILREGERADAMFFVLSGQVSVVVSLDHRRAGRISTLSAGSAFGEMALLDHGVRSAYVIADTPLSCQRLDYERLENDATDLGVRVRLKLITNVARVLSQKLRQATLEIKSLRS